jgi:Protein related to penicillin acylase
VVRFFPIDGTDTKNSWQGFEDGKDLPNIYNPEEGYFVTANQDLNKYGNVNPSNISMADFRASRIQDLLATKNKATLVDMKAIQMDVYSKEAEGLMKIFKNHLKDCENSEIFKKNGIYVMI